MPIWSLKYGNVQKSFADWWLNDPVPNYVNGNVDSLTFTSEGRRVTEDELFPPKAELTIYRDNVPWFTGIVTKVPREGSPAAENMHWELQGAWYYFEQLIFQQAWNFPAGTTAPVVLTAQFSPRAVLNFSNALTALTIGQQITNVVNYVAARTAIQYGTARIQMGTCLTGPAPAADEVLAITCAEAIRRQLKYCPDAAFWIDYTTSPPTFHCRTRRELKLLTKGSGQNFGTVNINILDLLNSESLRLTPRSDLQRPSVLISYEKVNEIDGRSYRVLTNEIAPAGATGLEVGAFVAPINLAGARTNILRQSVETEDIVTSPVNSAAAQNWWKSHIKKLAETNVINLIINAVTREPLDGQADQGFTKFITRGAVADWMDFDVQKVRIRATVTYTLMPDGIVDTAQNLYTKTTEVYLDLNTTNANTGDYQSLDIQDAGEQVLPGVAQWLYDGLSELQYEGDITLIEDECSGRVRPGDLVNIIGGRPEWATMQALVQSVTEEISEGRTNIHIGPVPMLEADLLVDLVRVIRSRRRETNLNSLSNGQASGSSISAELPQDFAKENSQDGNDRHTRLTARDQAKFIRLDATARQIRMEDGTVKMVIIDLNALDQTAIGAGLLVAQFRKMKVCVSIGGQDKQRSVMGLFTQVFRDSDDPA